VRCQINHDRADAIAVAFDPPLLLEQAEFLARRVKKEAGNDPKLQIEGSIRSR